MIHLNTYERNAQEAARQLANAGIEPVDIVLQCGSGLAGIASSLLKEAHRLPLDAIPHLPTATVTGHGKEAIFGRIGHARVLILTGRIHLYEGHDAAVAGFPAAIAAACRARLFIATNAAGALNPKYSPGDVMLHEDYINHQGDNAVACLDFADTGQRFLSMNPPYHRHAQAELKSRLRDTGLTIHSGTYLAVRGPVYETRAEYMMMRGWGADAIGMSTIPEVTVCRLFGLPVVGLSVLTNECLKPGGTSHAEVVAVGQAAAPMLAQALTAMLEDKSWPTRTGLAG
ncbi:purine-nucleoside phosphorylase [bacterium]|nr:purine-nucleoside phosphorylase [bacterium]